MTKARDIATSSITSADLTAEVGSTIQAHDADLDTISGLAKTDGNVIVGDGTNWVAEDPATVRTSLGLGTAATTAATDYATAAQGSTADSAVQPGDNVSTLTNDSGFITGNQTVTLSGDVTGSGTTAITASVAPGSITEAKLSAGAGGANQILTSNGSGTLTWAAAAAGGFSNMQAFTGPGTWTNPGSVTKVKVTVTGGGGGGIRIDQTTDLGSFVGGGGAGGTAIKVVTIPTSPVPVTVPGPANPGAGGGTSSFGAHCSASGGSGGIPNGVGTGYSPGGVGSGGTINIYGGLGTVGIGGQGGGSIYGSGSAYSNSSIAYGSGGQSFKTSAYDSTFGGRGGGGLIIVEW